VKFVFKVNHFLALKQPHRHNDFQITRPTTAVPTYLCSTGAVSPGAGSNATFPIFNLQIMTNTLLFLSQLGATEFLLIFLVVVLLFGGKKIPELMRGLGKGIREFNNAKNAVEDEIRQGMRETDKKSIDN
jgi:sec-independent protein translocase protein TatA